MQQKGSATKFSLALIMAASICACSKSTQWKEEALLHDGSKLIVVRSQNRATNQGSDKASSVVEQFISFTLPGTNQIVTWKSEHGGEPATSGLIVLALDILDGVPYLATSPIDCYKYNQWKRPNPPYVFFKFDGATWKRIPLEQFPAAIQKANIVINTQAFERHLTTALGAVPVEDIGRMNMDKNYQSSYLHTIDRKPMKGGIADCSY
jgi:hypothetical protein